MREHFKTKPMNIYTPLEHVSSEVLKMDREVRVIDPLREEPLPFEIGKISIYKAARLLSYKYTKSSSRFSLIS